MDEFQLEEYKQVKTRLETHEQRYYQLLVLCVSGFAAVLGLSEKLPEELIPYMVAPLLYITAIIAITNRQHQFFASAFLLEVFERKIPSLMYEQAYVAIFSRSRRQSWIWDRLGMIMSMISHPFIILTILSIIGAVYFGKDFIVESVCKESVFGAIVYVAILACIHAAVVLRVIRHRQHNIGYYRERCREFVRESGSS